MYHLVYKNMMVVYFVGAGLDCEVYDSSSGQGSGRDGATYDLWLPLGQGRGQTNCRLP